MAQQITRLLDDPTQAVSLDTFSGLTKGCPAPFWLFQGVCAAWGIDHQRAQLNLITVSENATFLLLLDGEPQGVVRVSQPGYVGGPEAVASEISWLNALHDIEGISLINPVPTIRGTFVTKITDLNGVGWTVISTKYVEGTVLEDLENPAPYYETIGEWAAKFHEQSRTWSKRTVSPASIGIFRTWLVRHRVGDVGKTPISPTKRSSCATPRCGRPWTW